MKKNKNEVLKYYGNPKIIKSKVETVEEKLLYMLECEWISFESELDKFLVSNDIELPDEFYYTNNSSNATAWIMKFQELGYNVTMKRMRTVSGHEALVMHVVKSKDMREED